MHMDQATAEEQARRANAEGIWDRLWGNEGDETWRQKALAAVYDRITYLIPPEIKVIDLGGGVGILGARFKERQCDVTVCDISTKALKLADNKGLNTLKINLEQEIPENIETQCIVGTEILEHLSESTRDKVITWAANQEYGGIFSVPNDRLGPEDEKQHTIKFTAAEFKKYLEKYHEWVRIEVVEGYLIGVVGKLAEKKFRMSVCFPARDEAKDIEKTLISFRAIADQMVIGVDPRTEDPTKEIAEKYADEVFFLENPQGPPDADQGENGVHFAWVRNQCIDRCKHEWIFMTEAHEYLRDGQDMLLNITDIIPERVTVALVAREGARQRWAFPWLFRNNKKIRFDRPVHNILKFPPKAYVVKLPQIVTFHERHEEVSIRRGSQRRSQNRSTLYDDWLERDSTHSLFYLAQEWRNYDPKRAIQYFEEFLKTSKNGPQNYQARLILAKEYMKKRQMKDARRTLVGAVGDDWMRTEHWIWLGDLAYEESRYEEAYIFYAYSTILIGSPPFTQWWADTNNYTYLPPQRMVLACAQLGRLAEGCAWAKKVIELIPDDSPEDMVEECKENIRLFEEAMVKAASSESEIKQQEVGQHVSTDSK